MKKSTVPVLIVLLLILLVGGIGVGGYAIQKYMPSREEMDLTEYYGAMNADEAALILGGEILSDRALVSGGTAYLPLSVVTERLNQRFYWDSENSQVLYATPSELHKSLASQEAGGEVWLKDGNVYVSLALVQTYTDLDAEIFEAPNRVVLQNKFTDLTVASATKGTYVRYRGGIKSPVLTQVGAGEQVTILGETENWYQVSTRNGFVGYVKKKDLSSTSSYTSERTFQAEEYTYLTMSEKVNLVWHQVTTEEANATLSESIADMTGVNVISPTWYSVISNDGDISSLASWDYVEQAHEAGLKVWGLIDNFNTEVSTETMLASTNARQNLIRQLVNSAVSVEMDGINVDFESLTEASGIHFLEFLRELSIECHKNQLVLSVDNPVPAAFTSHYDRAEQGRVTDYVVIMGYDEHYYGSDEGSVASLPWVEEGIQNTLQEVSADRVINGMPFYTRLWKTQAGTLSSEAIGMDQVAKIISENHVEPYWDNTVSQNVGIYETDEASYKIWIEDNQSIAEKVKLANKYNLAGVAAWKLGFENSSIWKTISDNLEG